MIPKFKKNFIQRLLGRPSLLQKFLIVTLFFGSSYLLLLFSLFSWQSREITEVQKELYGTNYLFHLRQVYENVLRHQIEADRFLRGETTDRANLLELQAQINNSLKELQTVDFQYESSLHTTAKEFQLRETPNVKPSEIERSWSEIERNFFNLGLSQLETLQGQLREEILMLFTYIGETSQLNFDNIAQSSYLVPIVTRLIPQSQSQTIELYQEMRGVPDTEASPINKNAISLSTLLVNKANQIEGNINRSMDLGKNFRDQFKVETNLKEPLSEYLSGLGMLINTLDSSMIAPDGNRRTFEDASRETLDNSFALYNDTLEQLNRLIQERLTYLRQGQWTVLATSLPLALIAFLIGYYYSRQTTRALSHVVSATEKICEGNYAVRIDVETEDEIGRVGEALNQLTESFHQIIGQIQWAGVQLSSTSTEIAAAAKQQEATIVQQEATTKQIAATAREISTTAKGFAITMGEVSNNSEQTSALATAGRASLGQMETIMKQMVEASQNIASKLAVLNEKAGTITSVITTIAKVADQTNLLSLNAAIEAEKAGEHGRSFSVIAREIRRLADQTANATLDIDKMVTEMVSAVSAGVMGVDKFSEEIHAGVKHLSTVNGQLSKIIEQVQQQTTSFETVNQGMQAQSLGAEQITESISQLIGATAQTSESIRQFHNGLEQLNTASKELQEAVSQISDQ